MKVLIMSLLLQLIVFMIMKSCEAQTVSFLINCGTNSSVNIDGRRWVGDKNLTPSVHGVEASTGLYTGDPLYKPLYTSARVFIDTSNYTFRVIRGNYLLRLHFYPQAFDKYYNVHSSYFSVNANGLKLLSGFNVLREISSNKTYKEYFFSVNDDVIVVNFIPSKGSFAFVNAIEVIQEGDKLFVNRSLNLMERGIETMYRLNIGGLSINPSEDSTLWRLWEMDSRYMINSDAGSVVKKTSNITLNDTFVAPLGVYETGRTLSNTGVMEKRFNMSWKLKVHPGFDYLIRLHFCELHYDKANQRTFKIYIDNKTVDHSFDIYVRAGGMNKAYHEDFLDSVSRSSNHIWVQLGPDLSGSDPLLNGLEVFKIGRDGNLANNALYRNQENKKTSKRFVLCLGIGGGIVCVLIVAVVLIRLCKKGDEKRMDKTCPALVFLPFTLAEIKAATDNFDESLVIGVGGFGKVYKGKIDDRNMVMAVKRSNPQSQQGLKEFETEIQVLSKLRHRHLVSLIGFCDEQKEMILVYEFMANGTLRSHLFGSDLPCLSWKQRVEICIGAARGLHYLHTGSERGIIHRDVKTTNILLDENLVAKMSDFGLSKKGPSLDHTHVSTAVKGSFGYLDPEYFRRQRLTEKSDVYSFGVVLFEVVCGRGVIDPALPKDEICLAEWALKNQREGLMERIVDPRLKGECCQESLTIFGDIAEKCLADEGKFRPTMGEVLWHLEYVLKIHEAWLLNVRVDDAPGPSVDRGSKKSNGEVVDEAEFSLMVNFQGR